MQAGESKEHIEDGSPQGQQFRQNAARTSRRRRSHQTSLVANCSRDCQTGNEEKVALERVVEDIAQHWRHHSAIVPKVVH